MREREPTAQFTHIDQIGFDVVVVGYVDHGKSSLLGRILLDTDTIPAEQVHALEKASARRGIHNEWAYALDSSQEERDLGVTIETTRVAIRYKGETIRFFDCPGHIQYVRNMVTGAHGAQTAILLLDATEYVRVQAVNQLKILRLLGIRDVILCVNKMDLVAFDKSKFEKLAESASRAAEELSLEVRSAVPVSAILGDNVVSLTQRMPWYRGKSLLDTLLMAKPDKAAGSDNFLLPIQGVYRSGADRYLFGRIEGGKLKVGDRLRSWKTGAEAVVTSIPAWNATQQEPFGAGTSVALMLDPELLCERGDILTSASVTLKTASRFSARLVNISNEDLRAGEEYDLAIMTSLYRAEVVSLSEAPSSAGQDLDPREHARPGDVSLGVLRLQSAAPYDEIFSKAPTNRGILLNRDGEVVGAVVLESALDDSLPVHDLERVSPPLTNAPVIWLTGLPGSGKTTIATAVVNQVRGQGRPAILLDGDVLRSALSADLDFSPAGRSESVRRAACVAQLISAAGIPVIVSLVSPTQTGREMAKKIIGDSFRLVYVNASSEVCASRDPKGLYARARGGQVVGLTGFDADYEAPLDQDLEVLTEYESEADCVKKVILLLGLS